MYSTKPTVHCIQTNFASSKARFQNETKNCELWTLENWNNQINKSPLISKNEKGEKRKRKTSWCEGKKNIYNVGHRIANSAQCTVHRRLLLEASCTQAPVPPVAEWNENICWLFISIVSADGFKNSKHNYGCPVWPFLNEIISFSMFLSRCAQTQKKKWNKLWTKPEKKSRKSTLNVLK